MKMMLKMYNKRIIMLSYLLCIFVYMKLNASAINEKEMALHHFMQGEFLMDQGNYALAVLEFQDAIAIDPNASTIHVSIADAYRRLGKVKRTENHLRIALELDPNEVEALEMLGQLFVTQKHYIDAEEVFKKLNKSDPNNLEYIFALADLAQIQKNWDLAMDYYIKGYELNNMAINALEQALQIALSTSNFNRAEKICELLLNEDPDNIKLLQTMKDLSLFNKNYTNTLEILDKLEKFNGYSSKLIIEKSAIYEELDQPQMAIDVMFEAVKKDSQNLDILNRLVTLLMDQDKDQEALIYNQQIIDFFPNDPRGFINNAIMAMGSKMPEEAILILKPHFDRFSKDFTFNYLLGTAYYQVTDYVNSKLYLSQALNIYPDSRNTKHNLALIYDSTGEWEKSDKLYMELISSDSTDAQAYNNYAYSLVERDLNIEFALELAKNAIRLSPNSAAYLDTIGWIYFKLNQYDEALQFIKESLVIDSGNITIQEHLNQIIKVKEEINKLNTQQVEN